MVCLRGIPRTHAYTFSQIGPDSVALDGDGGTQIASSMISSMVSQWWRARSVGR